MIEYLKLKISNLGYWDDINAVPSPKEKTLILGLKCELKMSNLLLIIEY